jgi:hypothetical protein
MDEAAAIREILSIPHRCCICERLDRIEFDYMCEIQYQVIRNDDVKSDFIKKGFCNFHFWCIVSLTTPEAIASMGMMLIENDSFPSTNNCLICEHLRTKEAEFLNGFKRNLTGTAFGNSEQSERRLCQPHFRLIMNQLNGEIAEYFSNIQKLHKEQLLGELKGFVKKRDKRSERNENEGTSWWRAVEKLVGRKGMWGK